MAHGITLKMQDVRRPRPQWVVRYEAVEVKRRGRLRWERVGGRWVPYVNPDKDRTLSGKARRRARRADRLAERVPFFKGHGIATSNAFNKRYDCPCGRGIIAPLDDFDFMTEVMDHEAEHAEAVAR